MRGTTALLVLLVEDAPNDSSLKLPQTSHKPDNTVICMLFIIIIIFTSYWPQTAPASTACELPWFRDFWASPQPPRNQMYLKPPQTLHKPDDIVIGILFIITLFFHNLLAPHRNKHRCERRAIYANTKT